MRTFGWDTVLARATVVGALLTACSGDDKSLGAIDTGGSGGAGASEGPGGTAAGSSGSADSPQSSTGSDPGDTTTGAADSGAETTGAEPATSCTRSYRKRIVDADLGALAYGDGEFALVYDGAPEQGAVDSKFVRVALDGTQIGPEVDLAEPGSVGEFGYAFYDLVASDGGYLLVTRLYDSYSGGSWNRVFLESLDPEGTPVGPPLLVDLPDSSTVITSTTDAGVLIVGSSLPDDVPRTFFFAAYNTDGTEAIAPTTLSGLPEGATSPAAAAWGSETIDIAMYVFTGGNGGDRYFARFTSDGSALDATRFCCTPSDSGWSSTYSATKLGDSTVLAWVDENDLPPRPMFATTYASDGTALQDVELSGVGLTRDPVAAAGHGEVAIAWNDTVFDGTTFVDGSILFARVGPDGSLVEAPIEVSGPPDGPGTPRSVVADATGYAVLETWGEAGDWGLYLTRMVCE